MSSQIYVTKWRHKAMMIYETVQDELLYAFNTWGPEPNSCNVAEAICKYVSMNKTSKLRIKFDSNIVRCV